jgi:hypothetical protein
MRRAPSPKAAAALRVVFFIFVFFAVLVEVSSTQRRQVFAGNPMRSYPQKVGGVNAILQSF